METDRILLTGVCYVSALLKLKFGNRERSPIQDVHPYFDLSAVDFFRPNVAERFLFTDFHGRFSTEPTEATELRELLRFYNNRCQIMYVVASTGIATVDMATILSPADFQRISAFWYFLFNEEWNPLRVKEWSEMRDQALLSLMREFPKLRFIMYEPKAAEWWLAKGLPRDRLLYWNIDWGMTRAQYEEIRQAMIARGEPGNGHRFPTESSYNELCELILQDSLRAPLN